jgi:hypothetical protein
MASYQTLSSEWIGCGDYAQWSSREASGRAVRLQRLPEFHCDPSVRPQRGRSLQ